MNGAGRALWGWAGGSPLGRPGAVGRLALGNGRFPGLLHTAVAARPGQPSPNLGAAAAQRTQPPGPPAAPGWGRMNGSPLGAMVGRAAARWAALGHIDIAAPGVYHCR
jgi:hypothetical protein